MPVAGERLGPYEVVSPQGAGGMGEIYLAHDTRLDREVALTVLPAELSSEPARVMVTRDDRGDIRVGTRAGDGERRIIFEQPTPDLTETPFHTLPHEVVLCRLRGVTNLRIVENPRVSTGYEVEAGSFPDWAEASTW